MMFKQLKKDFDKTIILVSHDPGVMQVADRVIHLQDGRIVS